ncbi:hypothetical protein Hanom_Chr04g00299841 [Helianthus anomalus]
MSNNKKTRYIGWNLDRQLALPARRLSTHPGTFLSDVGWLWSPQDDGGSCLVRSVFCCRSLILRTAVPWADMVSGGSISVHFVPVKTPWIIRECEPDSSSFIMSSFIISAKQSSSLSPSCK